MRIEIFAVMENGQLSVGGSIKDGLTETMILSDTIRALGLLECAKQAVIMNQMKQAQEALKNRIEVPKMEIANLHEVLKRS
jgi:hypothetical protein